MLRRTFLKATAFLSTLPFIGRYVKADEPEPVVQEFWLIDQARGAGKTEWCRKKALDCLKKYKTTVVIGATPRDFMRRGMMPDFIGPDGDKLRYGRAGDTIILGDQKYGDHRLIIMPMNFRGDTICGVRADAIIVDNLDMMDREWLETSLAGFMAVSGVEDDRILVLCGTSHSQWFKTLERGWLERADDPRYKYIPRTTPISEVEV